MSGIIEIFHKEINGLQVKLFEIDINDKNSMDMLREYLVNKVKNSKTHNIEKFDVTYLLPDIMDPEFIEKFKEQVAAINVPERHKLPQYDVRRERVSEWMAQYLLEKEYGCVFYNEADKRINLDTVDIDKHTSGIDVPGIYFDDKNEMKFVVCEVKASASKIPCTSTPALQEDIQKAIDNEDNRVSRDILQYMEHIKNINVNNDIFIKILRFLAQVIVDNSNLSKNVMFFPFLLRNNENIVKNKDLSDYDGFVLSGVDKENVENIILSFEKKIEDFSNDIYDELGM